VGREEDRDDGKEIPNDLDVAGVGTWDLELGTWNLGTGSWTWVLVESEVYCNQ
jgi:hypothetical protein